MRPRCSVRFHVNRIAQWARTGRSGLSGEIVTPLCPFEAKTVQVRPVLDIRDGGTTNASAAAARAIVIADERIRGRGSKSRYSRCLPSEVGRGGTDTLA